MRRRHKTKIAAPATIASTIVALAVALGACASPPADPAARAAFEQSNDPLEPTNRVIFDVNMFVDKWAIEPLAEGYRDGVPEVFQIWVRNFLGWLREPTVFANDLLQGDVARAGNTTARFMINGLIGPFGLRDMAKQAGYLHEVGDFGQTLHVWGFSEGPYLMLPLLGPSNVRDAIGLGADTFIDPFRYMAVVNRSGAATWGRFGAEGIDERAQNIDTIDELKRNAVDFYAELRSIVRQRRSAQLHEPSPAAAPGTSDLYSDPALIGRPAQ
jgi:phospholipid-binding lipoprotein MlaA